MILPLRVRFLNFFRQIWMVPFLESWLVRRTVGAEPDEGLSRWVPNPYQYPSPSLRRVHRHGIDMQVDISDYIGHYLYFGFQDDSTEKLFSLVKPDAHILDVGANIGWTALRMASLANRGWVRAFEPDPVNFARCQANVSRNTAANLKVLQAALGSRRGVASMEVRTPSNLGGNRVAPQGQGTEVVEIWPLDEIIDQFPDAHIDLIKVDVEGYEMHVLRGAAQTLRRSMPVLFVELDDNNLRDQGDSAESLVTYLEDLGYSLTDATTGASVRSGQNFQNCHTDIIAR